MLILARPAALWLLLVAAPVVVLYFLRMRFRRQGVGSTFIWRSLVGKTSGGNVLRMRSLLLLLLQVAAVAWGALAAAGPALRSKRILRPGTAFLVDLSASMACDDASGFADRAAAAAAAVERGLASLGPDEPAMVFGCASGAKPLLPEPVFGPAAAAPALRALKAGSAAFSEADCADDVAAWLALRPESWRAVLVTDGGLDMGGRRLAAVFDGVLRAEIVGSSGESLAVSGLRVENRPTVGPEGGARATFSLWNGFGVEMSAELRLTGEGNELGSARIAAKPGWSRAVLPLRDAGAGRGAASAGASYTLRVLRGSLQGGSAPGAECYLAVNPRRAVSVLLVGREDPFLKAALAFGGITVTSSPTFPDRLFDDDAEDGPDLVISEAVSVPGGLRRSLLAFGAVPPDAPAAVAGAASGAIAPVDAAHPLARFVDWSGAKAESGIAYRVREGADVVATIGGRPSIVAWTREGYRFAACGVDLARSDLGLKSAFPVLVQNFIQWCVPRTDEQSAYTLVAGEEARRAEPTSFKAEGASLRRDGPAAVIEAREAGLYSWERPGARGVLAVNVPPGELDSAPRQLELPPAAGSPASVEATLDRPLGVWAILLLLACLAAEWMLWRGLPARGGGRT